jgi:hypothetical protein
VLVKSGVSNWENQLNRSGDSFSGEAFQLQVEAKRQLVVVKFGNRVTAEEIGEYVQKLRVHPSFQSTSSEIVDLRGAKDIELQADDFLTLADEVDPFSPEAKRAFVAKTSVQNHAARMHEILRSHRNIEIFRTFEEAERWIGS